MLVLLEGLVGFLFVLMSCVIGIANGPHNMVFFYDQEVQDRVAKDISLWSTTMIPIVI